jgi:hypothetical protein
MVDYGKVQSTVKPKTMVFDEYSVWVHSNIEEVENETFGGYEFNMVRFGKDEYIQLLDKQLTDTQLALVEMYELIGG